MEEASALVIAGMLYIGVAASAQHQAIGVNHLTAHAPCPARPVKGWYVLTDWKGKRKAKFFGPTKADKKQGQEFADKLSARLKWAEHSGEPIDLNQPDQTMPTLKDYLMEWLRVYADAHCKPSTASGYRMVVEHHHSSSPRRAPSS